MDYGDLWLVQAEDRILLVTDKPTSARERKLGGEDFMSGNKGGLSLHHIKAPPAYVAANWPLVHVAVSPDAADIAVAGIRGICLYSCRSGRWRLFGDVSQEREISVKVRLAFQCPPFAPAENVPSGNCSHGIRSSSCGDVWVSAGNREEGREAWCRQEHVEEAGLLYVWYCMPMAEESEAGKGGAWGVVEWQWAGVWHPWAVTPSVTR